MNRFRNYVAEFIGTFALVFAGTGAIVVNDTYDGVISHAGVAATFGLVVMCMIYAVGDLSGAHLNPAVTLGFWAAGRLSRREVLPFITSQTLGALLASGLYALTFPQHESLGMTSLSVPLGVGFVFEIILTFLLMFVILHVSSGAQEKGLMAGIAIGGTVALAAMFAGPLTGASMNPARSLAPALMSGQLAHLWLYVTAPILGAALAVLSCHFLRDEGCCAPTDLGIGE
jgi:aquaporin Z